VNHGAAGDDGEGLMNGCWLGFKWNEAQVGASDRDRALESRAKEGEEDATRRYGQSEVPGRRWWEESK
jgi:hypothetical protein